MKTILPCTFPCYRWGKRSNVVELSLRVSSSIHQNSIRATRPWLIVKRGAVLATNVTSHRCLGLPLHSPLAIERYMSFDCYRKIQMLRIPHTDQNPARAVSTSFNDATSRLYCTSCGLRRRSKYVCALCCFGVSGRPKGPASYYKRAKIQNNQCNQNFVFLKYINIAFFSLL